jgi:hypothetical protein
LIEWAAAASPSSPTAISMCTQVSYGAACDLLNVFTNC